MYINLHMCIIFKCIIQLIYLYAYVLCYIYIYPNALFIHKVDLKFESKSVYFSYVHICMYVCVCVCL